MPNGTQYNYHLSGLGGSVGHFGATLDDVPYAYNSPATLKAKLDKTHWTNAYSMQAAGIGVVGTLLLAWVGWKVYKKYK